MYIRKTEPMEKFVPGVYNILGYADEDGVLETALEREPKYPAYDSDWGKEGYSWPVFFRVMSSEKPDNPEEKALREKAYFVRIFVAEDHGGVVFFQGESCRGRHKCVGYLAVQECDTVTRDGIPSKETHIDGVLDFTAGELSQRFIDSVLEADQPPF